MSDPDEEKPDLPPLVDVDEDDEDDGLDDVTDVWDEEKLKAALGGVRDSTTGPATEAKRSQEASIQVSDDLGAHSGKRGPDTVPPQPSSAGGLSWPQTIGLALALAVGVYLLVSFLK